MRTSSPERWTWMRMPSSLASSATGVDASPPDALSSPACTSGALEASIGRTGRPDLEADLGQRGRTPRGGGLGDGGGRAGQHGCPA